MENSSECQLQIRLITTQDSYAVPDVPFSVPTNIDTKGLNELLNQLLKESNADYLKPKEFDFLAINELIRTPLFEHLQERNVSSEATIDVEYIERTPAPEPQESILHDDWVSSIQSTEKWILTGCYDNTVSIWTHHGKPVASLKDHTEIVKGVTWINKNDPSKGFISVSHDQTAIIWSWEEGTDNALPKIHLRGHEKGIDSVGMSPNGKRVATGGWDTNLKIWSASVETEDSGEPTSKKSKGSKSLATRTPLHTLKGHKESISSINWVDEHNVCTASMDHTIKFWDCELYGISNEIVDQKAFLSSSWSNLTKTLLASCADRHIRLYDPRSTEGTICKTMFTSHSMWVSSVSWSKYSENLFLSGSYDSTVKMWDTRSPKAPLYNLQGHEGQVLAVDWSNNKYLISGGSDNCVHIFKNRHVL
ncbi:ribosome biogenesis protein WDR12 homolog [Anthonomus grandis grandis]|uniref:ribosome biogenesis protein WDR12 homolog n=1 Tax=Anthonomus grandis grandis TaxID=2921223 RepID=UPI002166A003|nr:ribosome biogenesis protein WDR12 homolog [Anthonomus grandis grandis]